MGIHSSYISKGHNEISLCLNIDVIIISYCFDRAEERIKKATSHKKSRAYVSYDGKVFWPPIMRYYSSCNIDITYFPFDDQICFLKLGSWAYDGYQVNCIHIQFVSKIIHLVNLVTISTRLTTYMHMHVSFSAPHHYFRHNKAVVYAAHYGKIKQLSTEI